MRITRWKNRWCCCVTWREVRLKPGGRLGIVNFTKAGFGPGPPMDERVDPERGHPRRRSGRSAACRASGFSALPVHARSRKGRRRAPDDRRFRHSSRTIRRASTPNCERLVPSEGEPVQRSMAYTLHAPSKRVRPVLRMLSAELCGGTSRQSGRRPPQRPSSCTPRR